MEVRLSLHGYTAYWRETLTTLIYIRGTRKDLQTEVEKIAWR